MRDLRTTDQQNPFSPYLKRWALTPDGDPITTPRAGLLPVLRDGEPAMLKVSTEPEEGFGARLLAWWGGDGAARVLALEDNALLLERATNGRALSHLVREGRDDEATRITCRVIERLHAPRPGPLPDLIPLTQWFRDLTDASPDGLLGRAKQLAIGMLGQQTDIRPLHGDIHHDNILDFGERGWLVIDPKRLIGDRVFDYLNVFGNPDLKSAADPTLFERRLATIAEVARLDRKRLLQWLLAWSGLSAIWCINDKVDGDVTDPDRLAIDLKVAELAAAELDR
ncbi:streptomycin 3''-kinase [Afipia sp. P52-10]|uniref:aminoglycoside phosphotransferase family protein n=1 Tax=Afipia sp. P52-10 TaxID=1429916 RepID=UPI0003DF2A8D|nr:aminoglycoside phosphotransferase family protein [Afipia sp. P52-10]ETR75766.1 streptomycin 3''-kinase [Afipia sp. P52-10]